MLTLFLATMAFAADPDAAAQALFDTFVTDFTALDPPMDAFALSYEANFREIPDRDVTRERTALFLQTRDTLRRIRRGGLSPDVRYQYDTLAWEVGFALRRLRLEARLEPSPDVASTGLYGLRDGRRWYRLYLQRWASDDITPRRLLALGKADVARISSEIATIQAELGYAGRDAEFHTFLNGPTFWQTDEEALQASFRALRASVSLRLADVFEPRDLAEVQIARWEDATKDTPPGYWNDGTFYYTFFDGRFPARTTEWLFLHEAVPGHHFQANTEAATGARTPLLDLFWFPGFAEGWGAYAEDIGRDIGCFGDPYQYLGKWEWDRVRSARLVVDVGIHHRGWTRDEALDWWHVHVPNQDGIAEREIDRVTRWPAQVVSYKVGEHEILDLRAYAEDQLGDRFDVRRFHSLVLLRGSLPLPVLDEAVKDAIDVES